MREPSTCPTPGWPSWRGGDRTAGGRGRAVTTPHWDFPQGLTVVIGRFGCDRQMVQSATSKVLRLSFLQTFSAGSSPDGWSKTFHPRRQSISIYWSWLVTLFFLFERLTRKTVKCKGFSFFFLHLFLPFLSEKWAIAPLYCTIQHLVIQHICHVAGSGGSR